MSRWTEQLETGVVRQTWEALKASSESATIDDSTVLTAVAELARLKKVVAYINGIIDSMDADLVPISIWEQFRDQAAQCANHLSHFQQNRNVGHLVQANIHLDNLLSYVRPYMITSGKIAKALRDSARANAAAYQEFAEAYARSVESQSEEIKTNKDLTDALHQEIVEAGAAIEDARSALLGSSETGAGSYAEVLVKISDIDEKHAAITAAYNETLIGDEEQISTKKSIVLAAESIAAEKTKIEGLLSQTSAAVLELASFHAKIFGSPVSGEMPKGLAYEIDEQKKRLGEFEAEQKVKYGALNGQIEGLLPGATSAGLASAYKTMKDSFDGPIRRAEKLFYYSIGAMVIVAFVLIVSKVSLQSIEFVPTKNWDAILRGLAFKLPFYAPIIWIAYYASKRRSESQRLQQEYAHKEALAKSYDSYKKQIEELKLEDGEMQRAFISKAIDAISHNASVTLDGKHGDKILIQELIETTLERVLKSKLAAEKLGN